MFKQNNEEDILSNRIHIPTSAAQESVKNQWTITILLLVGRIQETFETFLLTKY